MKQPLGAHRRALAVLGGVMIAAACADSVAPVTVASVEVASPVGALLDVGGTAQLTPTARSPAGEVVGGVDFTWTSSNPSVVTISAAGFAEARAVGTATVRAETGGAGGSLTIRVVDADLSAIRTLAGDLFLAALIGTASTETRARLDTAVDGCTTGAARGELEAIQGCVADVQAQATAVSDPTDRVLLAVLRLFVDDIERLLGL